MSRHRVEVTYALETKGPLHIGTGHGAAGLHRAMLRDQHGLPYIPGSTIKGRARYAAIRICGWLGLEVLKHAGLQVMEDAVGDGTVRSPNGPHGERDLPVRIFGCAWQRCTLRFGDARTNEQPIVGPIANEVTRRALRERAGGRREVRTGAARSRILGTVSHRRLYRSEVAPPGLVFHGKITGHLECDERETLLDCPIELLVLWLALHLMVEDGVGGNKSSGSGKLDWAPSGRIAMMVDGALFAPTGEDATAELDLLREIEHTGANT